VNLTDVDCTLNLGQIIDLGCGLLYTPASLAISAVAELLVTLLIGFSSWF